MLLLPVVVMWQAAATAVAAPAVPRAAGDDPPARVARLSHLAGRVSFQPSGDTAWSQATLNYTITTGDRLYTDSGSRAELEIGRFAVRLSESTDLTVTNLTDQFMQLGLTQGTIRVSVSQLSSDDSIEVDTPNGALALVEPGRYRVAILPTDSATVVTVQRGHADVTGGDVREGVEAGHAVELTGANPVFVSDVPSAAPDGFDQWSAARDGRLASAPAQYVSRDIPGYEDLDDAGRWQVDADYGPVWYPERVAVDWVPYRDGRWVWVEPWGWTWVEDEPWGFAPFHYGRWVFLGSVWGWVPGPVAVAPCYAPALVVFVGGAPPVSWRSGVEAWFPLGPREPYHPWYHNSDDYRIRVNESDLRGVANVSALVHRPDINRVAYENRGSATTVVPATTFRNSEPIARHVVKVSPGWLSRAPITPHPAANPSPAAATGGRPAVAPPRIARPVIVPGARGGERPSERPNPLPGDRGNAPSERDVTGGAPRSTRPPQVYRIAAPESGPADRPLRTPPPLVAKRPPPPENVPFPQRQQAMQAHPGRPLEPQQVENLRAGRPAGPMRDQEFPPHPVPTIRAAPAPQPAPRPAANPGRKPGR
jgi:hypothetical protein